MHSFTCAVVHKSVLAHPILFSLLFSLFKSLRIHPSLLSSPDVCQLLLFPSSTFVCSFFCFLCFFLFFLRINHPTVVVCLLLFPAPVVLASAIRRSSSSSSSLLLFYHPLFAFSTLLFLVSRFNNATLRDLFLLLRSLPLFIQRGFLLHPHSVHLRRKSDNPFKFFCSRLICQSISHFSLTEPPFISVRTRGESKRSNSSLWTQSQYLVVVSFLCLVFLVRFVTPSSSS